MGVGGIGAFGAWWRDGEDRRFGDRTGWSWSLVAQCVNLEVWGSKQRATRFVASTVAGDHTQYHSHPQLTFRNSFCIFRLPPASSLIERSPRISADLLGPASLYTLQTYNYPRTPRQRWISPHGSPSTVSSLIHPMVCGSSQALVDEIRHEHFETIPARGNVGNATKQNVSQTTRDTNKSQHASGPARPTRKSTSAP